MQQATISIMRFIVFIVIFKIIFHSLETFTNFTKSLAVDIMIFDKIKNIVSSSKQTRKRVINGFRINELPKAITYR